MALLSAPLPSIGGEAEQTELVGLWSEAPEGSENDGCTRQRIIRGLIRFHFRQPQQTRRQHFAAINEQTNQRGALGNDAAVEPATRSEATERSFIAQCRRCQLLRVTGSSFVLLDTSMHSHRYYVFFPLNSSGEKCRTSSLFLFPGRFFFHSFFPIARSGKLVQFSCTQSKHIQMRSLRCGAPPLTFHSSEIQSSKKSSR